MLGFPPQRGNGAEVAEISLARHWGMAWLNQSVLAFRPSASKTPPPPNRMTDAELLAQTRAALPQWPEPVAVEAILKGGSDRTFHRVRFATPTEAGVILMKYTMARPDNPRFVPATRRLAALGVHVPRIFAHDTERMLVWVEDLGTEDLHAHRKDTWEKRRALYESTLREVAKLHAVDAAALSEQDVAEMELCFDERLYEWEQNYFLTHFVHNLRGQDTSGADFVESRQALEQLRQHLATLPRGLVHRDFQSQNVIIRNGGAWLIDYQGVRPGLAEYDLASLLLDPYVDLSESEREEMLQWYAWHAGRNLVELRERYWLCAAQRLMQALGAYANLSRNLNKPHFEEHIPVAVERLRAVCVKHPMLEKVAVLVGE
jgi:aminoglycoside/choline kinase family phosphotransferase